MKDRKRCLHEILFAYESASHGPVRRIPEFSVRDLVEKVLSVCRPEAKLPPKLPNPVETQKYLESLSDPADRQAVQASV